MEMTPVQRTEELLQLVQNDKEIQDRITGDQPAPWLMSNFVMSADGSYAVNGRSAGLGNKGDSARFHALRYSSDCILVAAGTARSEKYRQPSFSTDIQKLRVAYGLEPQAQLVILTRQNELPAAPATTGEPREPEPDSLAPPLPALVVTSSDEDPDLPTIAEWHQTKPEAPALAQCRSSDGATDFRGLLQGLFDAGHKRILCEGGPHLLGQLANEDLIDEFLLSLAPKLVLNGKAGLLGSYSIGEENLETITLNLRIHRYEVEDDYVFFSYRRTR